jgi:hypothetical protein
MVARAGICDKSTEGGITVMIVRSTGLGSSEMEGNFTAVEPNADYLIINAHTTAPVKWHVRVAVNFPDLLTIIKLVVTRRQCWWFLITHLFKNNKSMTRPDQF